MSVSLTRQYHLWPAFLVVGSVVLTLAFACATPFAAFAALAALTLPRNEALWTAGGIWLANQTAGFLLLHYPLTADCLAWGAALGVAMVIAVPPARALANQFAAGGRLVASVAGFVAAFVVHQLFLLILAATVLGGTEEFVGMVEAQIFAVNVICFAALLGIHWLAERVGLGPAPMGRLALHG